MDIDFSLRRLTGRISVTFERNDDPARVGSGPESAGFPWCHADVDYPAHGYDAVLGWIQLVRSDDNRSGGMEFEIDPLAFLGDLPHPFCWIGLNPQLFDAPSRSPLHDMSWRAHSFLCVPDGPPSSMEVHALAGFAWGFDVSGSDIALVEPFAVGPEVWEGHLAALTAGYPAWRFQRGFRST
ncbi:MAG: hypothetical protein GC157_11015 [Frankiales bacterium]|nr:hypothetical protein [Frankiales bacterium]